MSQAGHVGLPPSHRVVTHANDPKGKCFGSPTNPAHCPTGRRRVPFLSTPLSTTAGISTWLGMHISTTFCRQEMEDKKRKCWECRRRRLVCDLARPGCARCQSAGKSCPGYRLDKPLKWMQPPQEIRSRHAPRRQLEFACSSGSTDSQEPDLDPHAPSTTSTTEGSVVPLEGPDDGICQGSTERAIFILDPCALKIQQELGEVFESVEYCRYPPPDLVFVVIFTVLGNTIVCPDLVATGKGGQANPFFLPTCIVSMLPRSAVLTLVSAAIGHRLLRSYAPPTSAPDRSALITKLHHHRGESIRALTADLAEQDKQLSDSTLAAVLALLLTEVGHSSIFQPIS